MMHRTLIALTVAAATLTTLSAHARAPDSQKVQVLAVMSDDGFQQAQALTIALKRAVTRADGWSLGKGDFSLGVMVAALNCPSPPDSACQKKIGQKVGTKRYVWGTLKLENKKNVVAVLHLWQNGSGKKQTTLRYSANLTDASDDSLLKIAEDGFSKLVGGAEGKLVLTAGNVTGDVLVDGQPAGSISGGHAQLSLPAGEHEVRVRAAGYHEATGTVTIQPGVSADLMLSPSPVAGVGSPPDQGSGRPTDYHKIIGWSAVGVGGAVALTGGYFWLKSFLQQQNPPDYYQTYSKAFKNGNVCDHAQGNDTPYFHNQSLDRASVVDYCTRNAHAKTVAFVLIPVGAVIAGVGTYLLMTDKSGKQEKVEGRRIQPIVALGPGGGHFDVRMTF